MVRVAHVATECWGVLFCLVAALTAFLTRHMDREGSKRLILLMLSCALLLASDALAWAFRGQQTDVAYVMVRASNFGAFQFGFTTLALAVRYVAHIIESRSDMDLSVWVYVEYAIAGVGVVCLVANGDGGFIYAFDTANRYYRCANYWIPGIVGMLGLSLTLGIVIRYFDVFTVFERVAMVCYLTLPMVAICLQTTFYGVSFANIAVAVATLILFFAYEFNYTRHAIGLERKRNADRLKLIASGMRPHFIFNSLSLIRYMCRHDPDEVPHAIDEFSSFLRTCTDLFDRDECVSASVEFDLAESYAYMQEHRFAGELTVTFDLADLDFELPAFSVQTALENAITHGIRGSALVRDGRVSVRSRCEPHAHVVEVEDNGVGFEVSVLDALDDSHTGIAATRERLRLMCGGTLEVTSAPGRGTTAVIRVPKDRSADKTRGDGVAA